LIDPYRLRPHLDISREHKERRSRKVQAWLQTLPSFQKEPDKHIIRLDPIALFLIFFAVTSFVLVIVLTNTPILIAGPATDLGSIAVNYLLITAPIAGFAPLLVGSYFYDIRELGPILRPVTWGKKLRRESFPDVAILGLISALGLVVVLDYFGTYGGFAPTLSFWNTTTNKIVYADGGIFEEFIFRAVIYGTINRFPGVGKVLLGNPLVFFGFTAPLDCATFVIYHLKVYANSTLALSLVFGEAYILNGTYRVLRYPLWVVMLAHGAINFAAPP
jgi:membrane protease YdiL (CAAX protease family)